MSWYPVVLAVIMVLAVASICYNYYRDTKGAVVKDDFIINYMNRLPVRVLPKAKQDTLVLSWCQAGGNGGSSSRDSGGDTVNSYSGVIRRVCSHPYFQSGRRQQLIHLLLYIHDRDDDNAFIQYGCAVIYDGQQQLVRINNPIAEQNTMAAYIDLPKFSQQLQLHLQAQQLKLQAKQQQTVTAQQYRQMDE